jgi:hypothetical protein
MDGWAGREWELAELCADEAWRGRVVEALIAPWDTFGWVLWCDKGFPSCCLLIRDRGVEYKDNKLKTSSLCAPLCVIALPRAERVEYHFVTCLSPYSVRHAISIICWSVKLS